MLLRILQFLSHISIIDIQVIQLRTLMFVDKLHRIILCRCDRLSHALIQMFPLIRVDPIMISMHMNPKKIIVVARFFWFLSVYTNPKYDFPFEIPKQGTLSNLDSNHGAIWALWQDFKYELLNCLWNGSLSQGHNYWAKVIMGLQRHAFCLAMCVIQIQICAEYQDI